jgi:uncharacterized protein YkwD
MVRTCRVRTPVLIAPVVAGLLLLAPIAVGTARASGCSNTNAQPSAITYTQAKDAVLCLINRRRRAHSLCGLRGNGDLRSAARRHTADMIDNSFFSHYSSTGLDVVQRIRRTGYLAGATAWGVGENIAWGTGSDGTPARIVTAWMHSPGHRANILNHRFRQIGIGVVSGAPVDPSATGGTYTTDFGYRR